MPKIIGRLIEVGLAKESSRGAGAAPTFWLPKSNLTFEDKAGKARSVVNYGNILGEGNQALVSRKHAEGDIEFDLFDESFGLILTALLGASPSTSGPTDSAYTHTYTLQEQSNQHQSLSITKAENGIVTNQFRRAMLQALTITVTPEDVVKCAATFMSRNSASSSGSSSYTAQNKFIGRHFTLKLATDTSGLGAASNIPVRSFEITFEKNLRMIHNTASVEPEDILNQALRITGVIELDYEDRTYANLMLDGSYRAMRINLNNAQTLIGATSTPQLTLDFSRLDFDTWEQVGPNDEVASQSINFTALYDITNADIINACSLVNANDGTSY